MTSLPKLPTLAKMKLSTQLRRSTVATASRRIFHRWTALETFLAASSAAILLQILIGQLVVLIVAALVVATIIRLVPY